ncbi:glycosyltransferase family 4 protein [Paenibacillus sp. D2_2]|uniref:glycosyltransferase family 4 protein n=1 Tax=Paenibacillus sp. D2_2 TaxID=3073092 RepID=UPI0028154721|nr:glycosyltransferase family 4 protein [Paenibacillus sp. D2_2]WMT43331.1 glycosyltransferase family 4 protein [Paenibacillus sp. D2_2]
MGFFFEWAIAPVQHNTYIPNLLFEIYRNSPNLQQAFPDPLRSDQIDLLKWAQYNLANEFDEEDDFFSRFNIVISEDHLSETASTRVLPHLRKGINLVGFSRLEAGIGESCRSAARAIQSTNIPFGIINCPLPIPLMDLSWVDKEMKSPVHNVNILHMNPDMFLGVYNTLGQHFFNGRYNIGYWHWELPVIPEDWISSFGPLAEIWVPSSFVFNAVSKKTNLPVTCIPHCIQVECPEDIDRRYFELPTDRFLFLTMYDTRSILQRKNPIAAIIAFQKAFSKNDPSVGLVVKVNASEYHPEEVLQFQDLIKDNNNIFLINQALRREEINALIQSVDCFVSLHRSEGFGLVLAEAMYLGKPVIGTNWSGNTDFMDRDNSCAVDYSLIKVGRDYGPYRHDQIWAEPDIDHAAYYMQKLVSDPLWYSTIAEKGKETIHKRFSTQVIGTMIYKRLEKLGLI